MVRTKGRRLLACYHEAGHALTRWFFGHGIDRVVVLTVEEVLAGVMVENRKGVAIQCEGVCEGYDIHGFPYGPMLAPDYDEARQAEHVRHRAISRDMEFINCWAGSCAEAVHRKVSLVAVMMAGGDGDLEHFRTVLDAWGLDSRSPEGKAAWRFAETRAKALIRSPMGAAAVKSIAEALHERGELDGDEVAALCRDAYGGRQCRFGAWTDHWPPTLAQIRAGYIPERRPVSGAVA